MSSDLRVALGALVVAALLPATALAYVDPGTAGLVVGGGAGVIVWILGAIAFVKLRALRLFGWGAKQFKNRPGPAAGVAVALVVGLGALGWWLADVEEEPEVSAHIVSGKKFERTLLIGIDGLDPKVVDKLRADNLLPNLERIIASGGFKPFAVPNPAQSPVVWSSLATGKNPGQHGVFDFIGRDAERYLPSLALLSRDGDGYRYPIRAKAWWDYTTQHEVKTTLMRWPMTFPPAHVHGNVLPGLGVPDVRGNLGLYSYFTDAAPEPGADGASKVTVVTVDDGIIEAKLIGPRQKGVTGAKDLSVPFKVDVNEDGQGAVLELEGKRIAIASGDWSELLDVRFKGGVLGKDHRGLVRFHLVSARAPFALYATPVQLHPDEPMVPFTYPAEYGAELKEHIGPYYTLGMPEDTKALGDGHLSEEAFYAMCDQVEQQRRKMLLFELERFDSGVLAFVFDTPDRIQHMTPFTHDVAASAIGRYLVELDTFLGTVLELMPDDTPLIIFSDHGFSTFDRAVDLNRWLVDAGYMTVDEDAWKARKPGTNGELYRYVDWSKTKAYAVGFAGIYVNVDGREGEGIVPAEEREDIVAEIRRKLQKLKDPDDDADVVHATYTREEIYPGAHMEEAPDLVVGLKPGYRGSWQSAVGGLSEHAVRANEKKWQRDHIVDASFVSGTLITNFRIAKERPHVYDLAPTVLALLGLPVPDDMEGRPLHEGELVAHAPSGASDEATP
jgi:predicted AlkP superfamily phosphohydrolase/phosphomutase